MNKQTEAATEAARIHFTGTIACTREDAARMVVIRFLEAVRDEPNDADWVLQDFEKRVVNWCMALAKPQAPGEQL